MEMVGEIISQDNGWLQLDRSTGDAGTTNVTLTCIDENLGRSSRQATITATTSRGVTAQCVVTNLGADEFILMANEFQKIGDGESSLVVIGGANAQKLNVTLGSNATGVTISSVEVSTDEGTTWETITNNSDITGDPGYYGKYLFRITLAVSSFSLTSGNNLAVNVTGKTAGIMGETLLRPTSTTLYDSTDTYSLGSATPLTIIGTSDSGSLTLSGTLSALPCVMYLSFDNGATWTSYTAGTTITNSIIESGGHYMFKVEVDTSSLSAETADLALSIVDNTGTSRATETVSFTE